MLDSALAGSQERAGWAADAPPSSASVSSGIACTGAEVALATSKKGTELAAVRCPISLRFLSA